LSEVLIAALVGVYDTPIDGVAFTVSAHEGKIYVAQTGRPPEEIKPYRLNNDLVGFRLRRNRFDFVREKDVIVRMVLKTPDITVEAPRK
jgi:deoxyxylulose-5-phosphate synthase